MDSYLVSQLSLKQKQDWLSLLEQTGLHPDKSPQRTLLLYEDDVLVATGSRDGNVLKYIAVHPQHQGEDLTAQVLTPLRQDAFSEGFQHLFLYTKPKNKYMFSSLFFSPVAESKDVLLMESVKGGIDSFLSSLSPEVKAGNIGAIVMNANPFSKGHRYLIEQASKACDYVYLFVLSEDQSEFSFEDRFHMVTAGVQDLSNVIVKTTGPYLISSATFPTYFLKESTDATKAQCQLDCAIFSQYFAPAFGIRVRFVGSEPLSQVTNCYNETMKELLPESGIDVVEIPRLQQESQPISASAVRLALEQKDFSKVKSLVPTSTFQYLEEHGFLKG